MKEKIFIVIDVLFFSLIFLAIGFYINKNDPLFIKGEFNYIIFLLSIITLYDGLWAGLLAVSIFGIFMPIFYNFFPYKVFLENLLFTLIFGEFNYYWNRKFTRYGGEKNHLETKLKELGKAFFSLKFSHDQLEKNYVLRPVSIRNLLNEVRNISLSDENKAFDHIMNLCSKFFGVEDASIYINKQDGFKFISGIGKEFKFNEEDPLLKRALENKTGAYVDASLVKEGLQTDYLAVIPVITSNEEVVGVLIIKEMPFLSFNKDNLLMLRVLFSYFADQIRLVEIAKPVIEKLPWCPMKFSVELLRLSNLKRRFGIESTILILTTNLKENSLKSTINVFIESNLRGLDMFYRVGDLILILLPLTGEEGVRVFIDRIRIGLQRKYNLSEEDIGLSYRILYLGDLEGVIEELNGFLINI